MSEQDLAGVGQLDRTSAARADDQELPDDALQRSYPPAIADCT